MNAKELNFAYRVRHALNENLESLPESALNRLSSARKIALTHKKHDNPLRALILQQTLIGPVGLFFDDRLSWIKRVGLAVPLFAVAIGIVGIYEIEQQERITETADMDVAVLSDELPLTAYLDHGFNAYLARRTE